MWAGYRFVVLADSTDPSGLKVIDLGAGHSSASETLCGRIIAALKAEALLNESVGAGYIDRNWPPAFKDSGAWPLASLRQSFLNGALTRLLDPDGVLKTKLVEFVGRGDFGLASGPKPDGSYERLWFSEPVPADEVAFESGVVLLKKAKAEELKKKPVPTTEDGEPPDHEPIHRQDRASRNQDAVNLLAWCLRPDPKARRSSCPAPFRRKSGIGWELASSPSCGRGRISGSASNSRFR